MANSTIINGQTCLENRGIECREEQIVRNDYNKENEYSAIHPDAISDGDNRGKGSGHGGHTVTGLPDCNKPKGFFDYSNFDTSPFSNIGDSYDINGRAGHPGRNEMVARSLYGPQNPYGSQLIDTAVNVAAGQIQVGLQR